jgi:hypothetical protein
MNDPFLHLWHTVTKQFHTLEYSIHGPEHWKRVERNGLLHRFELLRYACVWQF